MSRREPKNATKRRESKMRQKFRKKGCRNRGQKIQKNVTLKSDKKDVKEQKGTKKPFK